MGRRRPRRRRLGLTRQRFEALVAQGVDDLPAWIQQRMENVDVLIEDEPPEDDPHLLGYYEGVPLTERGGDYFGVLPDRITLFRRTIEEESEDEEDLKEVVRETVIHEVAHFFGIPDDRLDELGRY